MVKFVALNNIVKSQEKCSPPCRTKRGRLHSEIASRILHREFSITAILRFFIRNVTFRQRFELVIHNCHGYWRSDRLDIFEHDWPNHFIFLRLRTSPCRFAYFINGWIYGSSFSLWGGVTVNLSGSRLQNILPMKMQLIILSSIWRTIEYQIASYQMVQ